MNTEIFFVLSPSLSVILLTIVILGVIKIEGSCVDDDNNNISLSIDSSMKEFEGEDKTKTEEMASSTEV